MPTSDDEIFRMSRTSLVGFCSAIALAVSVGAWREPRLAVLGGVMAAGYFWILSRWMTIRLRRDGVLLYRLNWLPWTDVKSVRRRSFLGLQYLIVSRPRGFAWWIPLYFQSERPIAEALLAKSPPEGAIHQILSTTVQ